MNTMIERKDLIKNGLFAVIAGPCAIESEEQIYDIAMMLSREGVGGLRAQFSKPRTNPEDFQGIGLGVLPTLEEIKRKTGLIIVSEIMDKEDLEPTRGVVDIIQIGSRNMQNTRLLKACGEDGRPVLLKRGLIATVKEWVGAAKYIGSDKVILCERGVRSGAEGDETRFTLDLGGALAAKYSAEYSKYRMPVIADPSHPAGKRYLVPGLARSIVAAGLDGMMIEVHQYPDSALCDAKQQIKPETFRELLKDIRAIYQVVRSKQLIGVA